MKTKVIQWGTGVTGRRVVQALRDHPRYELVGCYTTSASKNGVDVGEICGLGPIGVKATTDREAIYAASADIVLYMTLEEFGLDKPLGEICRLLESGKNVLSTAATVLIYPKAAGAEVFNRIDAAGRRSGKTFHATGVEPGWAAEVLPLILSGMLGRTESLLVQEILDYASYNSAAGMFELMRFGTKAQPTPPTELDPYKAGPFGAPLMMWPRGQGWYVTAHGTPSMRLAAEIAIDGGDPPNEASQAAAMRVINTIPYVCEASSGIKTFLDMPMIIGRDILSRKGATPQKA